MHGQAKSNGAGVGFVMDPPMGRIIRDIPHEHPAALVVHSSEE